VVGALKLISYVARHVVLGRAEQLVSKMLARMRTELRKNTIGLDGSKVTKCDISSKEAPHFDCQLG